MTDDGSRGWCRLRVSELLPERNGQFHTVGVCYDVLNTISIPPRPPAPWDRWDAARLTALYVVLCKVRDRWSPDHSCGDPNLDSAAFTIVKITALRLGQYLDRLPK